MVSFSLLRTFAASGAYLLHVAEPQSESQLMRKLIGAGISTRDGRGGADIPLYLRCLLRNTLEPVLVAQMVLIVSAGWRQNPPSIDRYVSPVE